MNCTTYTFGNFGHGFTQYPYDSTNDIFVKCHSLARHSQQMFVLRRERQMFYVFIKCLESLKEYIGFGVVISDMMITDFDNMYQMFEDAVRVLAVEGEILDYSGEAIISKTKTLENKSVEVRNLDKFVSSRVSSFSSIVKTLPPIKFAIATDSYKECSLADDIEKIISYTQSYGITVIFKCDKEELELNEIMGECPSLNNESFLDRIIKKFKL